MRIGAAALSAVTRGSTVRATLTRLFVSADPRGAAISERAERKVRERHTTARRAEEIHALCMAEVAKEHPLFDHRASRTGDRLWRIAGRYPNR
jgi:hypothetical protein